MSTNRDLPRDEHLRAALRHAPDADLGAPADVSAQILAAAHRAAAERPAAAPPPPRRRGWWSWLGSPQRLGTSGAFALVLMAGVIGLMWRGGTPGPATEAMAPPAEPPAANAPAASAAVVEPARRAEADAPPAAKPSPVARAAKDDRQALEERQASRKVAAEADATERRRDAAEAKARKEVEARPPAAPPPPPPPPVAIVPAAPLPVVPPAPAPAPAPATTVADNAVRLERAAAAAPAPLPAPAPAPALAAAPRLAGAVGATQALRQAPASAGGAPSPDFAWRLPQAAWAGEGGSRAPAPGWLQALGAQAQGRWRRAAEVPPAGVLHVLRMDRPGQPSGRLWLATDRVVWCGGAEGEACVEAMLVPEAAAALAASLGKD